MDFLTNLPEDLITVIVETLCKTSKISVVVWAHVSKFSYKVACKCAKENQINRILRCSQIAAEGSLEVLKWARSNDCRGTWQSQGSSTCPFGDKVIGIPKQKT